MNLDQYPRSKRFIEDSGYINESDLSEVQDEFTQSKDVLAVEKGKLTRARNNQDSKAFYSEMEKIDLDLSNVFSSSNRQKGDQKLKPDKTGKSKVTSVFYYFEDGGNASVQCYFYSKNYGNPNSKNNLRVGIRSSEYRDWYFSSSK